MALSPPHLWWSGVGVGHRAQLPPLLLGKELLVVCNFSETPEQCPLTSQVAPCFGGGSGWKMEKSRVGPG